jgi:hypothetical protein
VIGFHVTDSGWFMQLRRGDTLSVCPTDARRLMHHWHELVSRLAESRDQRRRAPTPGKLHTVVRRAWRRATASKRCGIVDREDHLSDRGEPDLLPHGTLQHNPPPALLPGQRRLASKCRSGRATTVGAPAQNG